MELIPQVSRPCIICGSQEKRTSREARLPANSQKGLALLHDQYNSSSPSDTWHYRVVECQKCHHRYADPIFDQATIETSYLEQTHDNEFNIDPDLLKRTNRGYADIVEPFLPPLERRLLQVDLGCDTGIFLQQTEHFIFKRRVGVEPGVDSAKRASQLPGVEVMQKIFDPRDFPPKTIDFLSLIHVLDHLVDSRGLLKQIRPALRDGAIVFAVVHNIDSLVAKISGESWAPLNLVHMEYFCKRTLGKLFEAEGYETQILVGTKNYFPLHHLIRFAPYVPSFLRIPLLKIAERPLFRSWALGLKLGNIAIVAKAV